MEIVENFQHIQNNIQVACERSGRSLLDVNIIAVTKSVTVERTREAVDAGLLHLGENRPEGLQEKRAAVASDVTWHYIGSLQSRKVKQIIDSIDVLHSLDRINLAKEIQKRANKVVDCFLQVNVAGEESKQGITINEIDDFLIALKPYDKIRVIGLMTMAPHTENEQIVREVFSQLKKAQQKVAQTNNPQAPCTELSMGMSNDYMVAIEEGATYVRIGTALVGEKGGDLG